MSPSHFEDPREPKARLLIREQPPRRRRSADDTRELIYGLIAVGAFGFCITIVVFLFGVAR